jgi:hypothetical protein
MAGASGRSLRKLEGGRTLREGVPTTVPTGQASAVNQFFGTPQVMAATLNGKQSPPARTNYRPMANSLNQYPRFARGQMVNLMEFAFKCLSFGEHG